MVIRALPNERQTRRANENTWDMLAETTFATTFKDLIQRGDLSESTVQIMN